MPTSTRVPCTPLPTGLSYTSYTTQTTPSRQAPASALTMSARQEPTAPGTASMLGRALRHTLATSSSQGCVKMAPGDQMKKAMCTARPSSFLHPGSRSSWLWIRHLQEGGRAAGPDTASDLLLLAMCTARPNSLYTQGQGRHGCGSGTCRWACQKTGPTQFHKTQFARTVVREPYTNVGSRVVLRVGHFSSDVGEHVT